MLVKLKVTFNPNWIENIIRSNENGSSLYPPKVKSTLFRKKSLTTLSGRIHPNISPKRVPKNVPKKSIKTIILTERLFILRTSITSFKTWILW